MRIIDADALAELLKREAEHHEADGLLERSYGVLDASMDVLQAPTVHPEPPKTGKWIDMGDFEQCSVCTGTHLKEIQTVYGKALWIKTPYCPGCGARMEGNDGND